jgi:hypothetical protein
VRTKSVSARSPTINKSPKRSDIDGFIISTPDHWQGMIGAGAAEAGEHIHQHKPLTCSIAEGSTIVEALRATVWCCNPVRSRGRSSVSGRCAISLGTSGWGGRTALG